MYYNYKLCGNLYKHTHSNIGLLLSGFIFLILTNYISTLIPLLFKDVIDSLDSNSTTASVIKPILISIVVYAVVLAATRTLSRILIFIAGRRVEYDLRNDLFHKLLCLSERFFEKKKLVIYYLE